LWLGPKFSRTLDTLSTESQKISKFDATRCQILRLKCTKFDFLWGSAPNPAGGAYSAPPDPLAVLKGPISNGRAGKEGGEGERKEKGRGGGSERRGREGRVREGSGGATPPNILA